MDEFLSSLNDPIEGCKAAIAAVDPLIASLNSAYESCDFTLTAMVSEYNEVQQGIVGSNLALDSVRENLRQTYEPTATLIVAIESCEAAFAALEAEYNSAIQIAIVDPDVALGIANLHHPSEHIELVHNNMKLFMIITGLLFAFNTNAVIEENDTAKSAPVGLVVADVSEEHNTAAPEKTAEHNTAAPEETVAHNTDAPKETAENNPDLPDLDPIMRHLMMIERELMALN